MFVTHTMGVKSPCYQVLAFSFKVWNLNHVDSVIPQVWQWKHLSHVWLLIWIQYLFISNVAFEFGNCGMQKYWPKLNWPNIPDNLQVFIYGSNQPHFSNSNSCQLLSGFFPTKWIHTRSKYTPVVALTFVNKTNHPTKVAN